MKIKTIQKLKYFLFRGTLAGFLLFTMAITGCQAEVQDANWFTVSYTSRYGNAPEKMTVKEGTKLSAANLPDLAETGFDFEGWLDGETKALADTYTVTKNVTLAAKWTESRYTATLYDNGTVTTVTATYGKKSYRP